MARDMRSGYVTFLPLPGARSVPVWQIEDGAVIAGFDAPLDGAPLFASTERAVQMMALVHPAQVAVRWTAMANLPAAQAETAARIAARAQALGDDEDLHVAARAQHAAETGDNADIQIVVATMSAATLRAGLDILAAHGCDPDIVLPAGLAITNVPRGYVRAQIGDARFVRGAQILLPDEPALITAIIGDAAVADLGHTDTETALAAAFCDPAINLRTGIFAKRPARGGVTTAQWRVLAMLLCTGLVFSLLLGIATWIKYDRAAAREDAAMVAAVKARFPGIGEAEIGRGALQRALQTRGIGTAAVTPLAASAYEIMQQAGGVKLREMRYSGDGILSMTISAANTDGINRALLIMQQQGYKVTATARQDASGTAMAEIRMRPW
jgi:general secretion pathway protein L